MDLNNISPADRADALYYFFGWQGGTIHQLSRATGLEAFDLLYKEMAPSGALASAESMGWTSVRTCERDWRRDRLGPQHQGDWPYWSGVIRGYWATGCLRNEAA